MTTKEEHINFWLDQAKDDWEAVNTLLLGKKYLQALFFAHLVIEKICKAIWIRDNDSNIPPKTHNLIYLISQTRLKHEEEKDDFLLNLNRFQLEGRYPDYISKMRQICDKEFTNEMIDKTNKIRLWLLENLQ